MKYSVGDIVRTSSSNYLKCDVIILQVDELEQLYNVKIIKCENKEYINETEQMSIGDFNNNTKLVCKGNSKTTTILFGEKE